MLKRKKEKAVELKAFFSSYSFTENTELYFNRIDWEICKKK